MWASMSFSYVQWYTLDGRIWGSRRNDFHSLLWLHQVLYVCTVFVKRRCQNDGGQLLKSCLFGELHERTKDGIMSDDCIASETPD